jgi:hypothetical protein
LRFRKLWSRPTAGGDDLGRARAYDQLILRGDLTRDDVLDDFTLYWLITSSFNTTGFVAIDLGPLITGGALHQVGAPLAGLELHFVRRLR